MNVCACGKVAMSSPLSEWGATTWEKDVPFEAECDETPTVALSRACLLLATTTGLLDIEAGRLAVQPEVRLLLIDAQEHVRAAFGEVQAASALVDQTENVEAQREHLLN